MGNTRESAKTDFFDLGRGDDNGDEAREATPQDGEKTPRHAPVFEGPVKKEECKPIQEEMVRTDVNKGESENSPPLADFDRAGIEELRRRVDPGKYVEVKDTVRSMKELVEGKHDHLPEQAFMYVGVIEEATEKAEKLAAEVA